MEPASTIFRFGDYESRARTRELYVRGSKLKIRPQPLRVLNLLLDRAGDVVTREELRGELWSAEIFVDFEHALNTSIKEIRSVLNDSATEPRYIETLPKLGYRFIAPVTKIEPASDAAPTIPAAARSGLADSTPTAGSSAANAADAEDSAAGVSPSFAAGASLPPSSPETLPAQQTSSLGVIAAIVIAVLLIGGAIAAYRWTHANALKPKTGAGATAPAGRVMIAVLPFTNFTGDATQDYFSEGMTEEMIAQLGHLDPARLGVIARTSVMHYEDKHEPLDQIARELGVQYVLEGSVRRDADKVRITAQLIQTSDQTHILSRQYDRELHDVLAVQGEIAHEISDEIQTAVGQPAPDRDAGTRAAAAGAAPLAIDAKTYDAYDDYLKGRYFWNKRSAQGFRDAAEYFQKSIAKDPTYARSYAGLADTYALMAEYSSAAPAEVIPKARVAALKALSLDERLPEAHASLALIAQNYDWDWQTADKEFRRAIELDPNYATGHHWYAEHLAFEGRFDEAFAEIARAMQLDPLSLIMKADNAVFLYFAGQYEKSIAQFREVLQMDPEFPRSRMVVFAYVEAGRNDEALAEIEKWKRQRLRGWTDSPAAYVYARTGHAAEARRELADLNALEKKKIHQDPLDYVQPYVALKEYDQAFAYLDKAVAEHSPGLTSLKVNPSFAPVRRDARFQAVLKRIGLGE
ncbi:MAG TPA: winged helix-turn-helix domain-containing protein [Candidatus Acidoferrales bacterium]